MNALYSEKSFWHLSVIFVLMIGFLFVFAYLGRQTGNGEKALFLNVKPSLIALDQTSFHDPILFQRASLLSASSLDTKAKMRQFATSIEAISAHPKSKTLWVNLRTQFIQLTPTTETAFALRRFSKTPPEIKALTVSPKDPNLLYGISKNLQIYRFKIQNKILSIHPLGRSNDFPQNMKLSQMWSNPVQEEIYVAFTNGKDSLIQTYSPELWQKSKKEIAIPAYHLKAGIHLSRDLSLLMDHQYHLLVLDWEKSQYVGHFISNPNFKDPEFLKSLPQGMALTKDALYLAGAKSQILELNWNIASNAIVLNRDVQLKNGHISLEWKMPNQKDKALYLAELSLTPRDLAAQKDKRIQNLPAPPISFQKAFGPMKESTLKIPYFETAYREFNMSLMAIHAISGKLMTPAVSFTVATEELKSW